LHAALRLHLGNHVEQRGSLVSPDRLRFDFVHFGPISNEELAQIEDTVNAHILASDSVEIAEMPIAEAKKLGAMALFGEKYGAVVRTVRMGDFSVELCGGTHLGVTSAAGFCRIISEGGVGANLRRIEALTGTAALHHDRAETERLRHTARELGAPAETAPAAATRLKSRVRELEKQLQAVQAKSASDSIGQLLQDKQLVGGVALAAVRAPEGLGADALRELAGNAAAAIDGVAALVAVVVGKVLWAV
jgi:alanyl-tRNA synthetase